MTENMIERAAKAIWETWPSHIPWDQRHQYTKDETREEARAALQAALDPEDEALVAMIAAVTAQYDDAMITTADHPAAARAVIERLREHIAQGHPSSQEQVQASTETEIKS